MNTIEKQDFSEKVILGHSFDMIYVNGGSFLMGDSLEDADEEDIPVHEVQLSSYYLGKYPVTQGLWESLMGNNPSFFKGLERPVEQVSWEDCQDFIKKLNDLTGKSYRLPTEAEWEYAARGGQESKGYLYAGNDKLKEVAWYAENSHGETKEVGQRMPNELGLYDMSGNVDEWCQDWYDGEFYKQCADNGATVNPQGPDRGVSRVYRGGSWHDSPQYCRVASRYDLAPLPEDRRDNLGFRLAMSLQGSG